MKEQDKKAKKLWGHLISIVFFMLIGAACGFIMVEYLDSSTLGEMPFHEFLISFGLMILGMYAAMLIQIIIHEAGHLVFGLLSGYKFSSFRIFSFMWIKEGDSIKFKRLSLAGTGGQCLMSPPDMVNGKIPMVMYNLGGSIMNVITAIIFIGLYFILRDVSYLPMILLFLAIIGFAYAIMNGVPMNMGTVNNDGYNAFSISDNKEALRSFWIQLKANEQLSKGVRLKDMPKEWFEVPSDEEMENSMSAVMGVFACNRLMDEKNFDEADALMEHMLKINSGIIGLHRNLLICDRIYIELISENRKEVLEKMLDKEQKKFMKTMKNYPTVIRTNYVHALLHEKDNVKAEKFKAQFEKIAKTYPYPNDIEAERELIKIADEII